jgi:hypothetical protein
LPKGWERKRGGECGEGVWSEEWRGWGREERDWEGERLEEGRGEGRKVREEEWRETGLGKAGEETEGRSGGRKGEGGEGLEEEGERRAEHSVKAQTTQGGQEFTQWALRKDSWMSPTPPRQRGKWEPPRGRVFLDMGDK